MLKNREELESFYKGLTEKFEGYIQMSDKRLDDLFLTPSVLPKWDELHNSVNYIVEMAFFDVATKKSILVRQHNSDFLVLEKGLTDNEIDNVESYYTLKEGTKMKMAQIWEEESNEFCLDMKVLEAKYLMFAGFEKGES